MSAISRQFVFMLIAATAYGQPAAPTSHEARMKWFREAKFGLFIHWGLDAIPAGEWKGKAYPGLGERLMHDARIPVREYEKLAGQFNPDRFHAEEWVSFAENAGAKYLVITAKHNDGFAMFRSAVSKYNVVDSTPFHRDPLKELAEACAKHHIPLGFYYSQAEDWHEPNGGGNDWDFGAESDRSFDNYLRGKAEPQVKELLTGYGPVALMWFDTMGNKNVERARRFIDIAHSLQPKTLINGQLGLPGDYLSVSDGVIPASVTKGDWEVRVTVNDTWGFKKFDNHWKSVDELIFQLVDTVSKGGNYLLNIGPTAEGILPSASRTTIEAMGSWLKRNGEAIYGAGSTTFGDELKASRKWRCTTKPGKLYITMFEWPDGPLELDDLRDHVVKAYLLADASRAPLAFAQKGRRVSLSLPKEPPIEGRVPDRLDPRIMALAQRTHVRTVVVLETKGE